MQRGLSHLRVIDFTSGIAGGYCTKLLADAGADVIKVEPASGDPLRQWTSSHTDLHGDDGALFRFLAHGKRSVIGAPDDASILELVAGADIVVEGWTTDDAARHDYVNRFPGLVVLAITPFGRGGPLSDRPTTEFIVQAEAGGLVGRGGPDQVPIQAGGRISEWVGATFAAVAVSAAAWRAVHRGHGEFIDFSTAATMTIAGGNYANLIHSLGGSPPIETVHRTFETPSVEPTLDGYVGFCTNSRQQFDDFLVLIERPDLLGDEELARSPGRQKHWDRWNQIVHEWTPKHTTAEIVRRASELRIPVAPVHSGENVMTCEQFAARGVYVDDPTSTFKMPLRPWSIDGEPPPPPRPAPRLGEHTGAVEPHVPARPRTPNGPLALPLDGVRVLDLTAWWAGPISAGMIAALGADVIHVESTTRPDGMRMTGGLFGLHGPWWERSGHYLASNTNKRGLTLDLTKARGLELLKQLIAQSDAIIENFTPRVMANFGLDWDTIRHINPRCILVRMPAFGLSGPWRDNTGFAQTMEQVTGLAWVTGHAWDQPRIQRGPSDPNAGMHAAFALMVGLSERDATGSGHHFEVTMVEGALNAAAEIALEYSAYGAVLERDGNRSPNAAPQGLYAAKGRENWLAISIETDDQWHGLRAALGDPEWARDPGLATIEGRRAAHDALDERLAEWAREREVDDAARVLVDHGVPAAAGIDPRLTTDHPQLVARKFYEDIDHAVVGPQPLPTVPFRFASVDRWLRAPAPLLGEHNEAILGGLLGLTRAELDELVADGIIGDRPKGA
jgi:crotonobetainyl-CoA:carnitine CoA-transferase CaiB-like acyl-CoA transferase